MTPSQRRRAFEQDVRRQVKARHGQIDAAALQVAGTLADLQARIRAVLERMPSDFDAARLPELLRDVDVELERWTARATQVAGEAAEAAWALGPAAVTGPLAAAQASIGRTLLPQSLLDELKGYASKGMADVGAVALDRIHRELELAVLGGQSSAQTMAAIGEALDEGPFRFIGWRAETVVRSNMGRIHSQAGHMRLADAAKLVPGLGKQWFWSGISRQTHAMADQQVREIDKPFLVGGEEMMYPRDPAASPENTINCGCESVPHKADW